MSDQSRGYVGILPAVNGAGMAALVVADEGTEVADTPDPLLSNGAGGEVAEILTLGSPKSIEDIILQRLSTSGKEFFADIESGVTEFQKEASVILSQDISTQEIYKAVTTFLWRGVKTPESLKSVLPLSIAPEIIFKLQHHNPENCHKISYIEYNLAYNIYNEGPSGVPYLRAKVSNPNYNTSENRSISRSLVMHILQHQSVGKERLETYLSDLTALYESHPSQPLYLDINAITSQWGNMEATDSVMLDSVLERVENRKRLSVLEAPLYRYLIGFSFGPDATCQEIQANEKTFIELYKSLWQEVVDNPKSFLADKFSELHKRLKENKAKLGNVYEELFPYLLDLDKVRTEEILERNRVDEILSPLTDAFNKVMCVPSPTPEAIVTFSSTLLQTILTYAGKSEIQKRCRVMHMEVLQKSQAVKTAFLASLFSSLNLMQANTEVVNYFNELFKENQYYFIQQEGLSETIIIIGDYLELSTDKSKQKALYQVLYHLIHIGKSHYKEDGVKMLLFDTVLGEVNEGIENHEVQERSKASIALYKHTLEGKTTSFLESLDTIYAEYDELTAAIETADKNEKWDFITKREILINFVYDTILPTKPAWSFAFYKKINGHVKSQHTQWQESPKNDYVIRFVRWIGNVGKQLTQKELKTEFMITDEANYEAFKLYLQENKERYKKSPKQYRALLEDVCEQLYADKGAKRDTPLHRAAILVANFGAQRFSQDKELTDYAKLLGEIIDVQIIKGEMYSLVLRDCCIKLINGGSISSEELRDVTIELHRLIELLETKSLQARQFVGDELRLYRQLLQDLTYSTDADKSSILGKLGFPDPFTIEAGERLQAAE